MFLVLPKATSNRAIRPYSILLLSVVATRVRVEAGGGSQEAGARALLLGFGGAGLGAVVVKSARGQGRQAGGSAAWAGSLIFQLEIDS